MRRKLNYYNEHDPDAAHWLRSLIAAGLIPDGHVDERSICDVKGSELAEFVQVHLFAGIGGWSHALQLAGWPSDAPVWTGSCPCQPFSTAGKRRGTDDERHLWPEMYRLVQECQPATVFGEQVASNDGLIWLAGVRADLEASGYAVGAADLPAACVGAPHRRQRLFWVADCLCDGRNARWRHNRKRNGSVLGSNCESSRLADAGSEKRKGSVRTSEYVQRPIEDCTRGGLGDTSGTGLEVGNSERGIQPAAGRSSEGQAVELPGNPWDDFRWVHFGDGKARRLESGTQPLVDGVPGRVALLRGLGNAIVPQVAARFIKAWAETRPTNP